MTARLVLWRARPPFRKVVRVRRITVGGFVLLASRIVQRVAEATVANGGEPIPRERIPFAFKAQDYYDFADQVCIGQEVGFFYGWLGRYEKLNRRNMQALLRATRIVEGPCCRESNTAGRCEVGCSGDGKWSEMLDQVFPRAPLASGTKTPAAERGGILADVELLCSIKPGLDEIRVLNGWTMQEFLAVCSRITRRAQGRAAGSPDVPTVAIPTREAYAAFSSGRIISN